MSATTAVTVGVVNARIVGNYNNADAKGKAKIRKNLQASLVANVIAGKVQEGQNDVATLEECKAKVITKVEINVGQVLADRIASLRLAANLLELGMLTPKDLVMDDFDHLTLVDFEADETTVKTDAGIIAHQKLTRSQDRHSIQAAFDRAFTYLPAGSFLTNTEIQKSGTLRDESGKVTYKPSTGAISVRLFPTTGNCETTLEGFEPVAANADNPIGAESMFDGDGYTAAVEAEENAPESDTEE